MRNEHRARGWQDRTLLVGLPLVAGLVTAAVAVALSGRPGAACFAGVVAAVTAVAPLWWLRWRRGTSSWGGVPVLFGLALGWAFAVGGIGHRVEYLGVRVSDRTYLLTALALVCFLVGAWVATPGGEEPVPVLDRLPVPRPLTLLGTAVVGLVGVLVTWVNTLTGQAALLSKDVLAARLHGQSGALEKLTAFAVGMEQFALMMAILVLVTASRKRARWAAVAAIVVLLATLALSGSRSFVLLPIGAAALGLLEWRRARGLLVLAIVVGGIAVMGAAGLYRIDHAIDVRYQKDYLRSHGFGTSVPGVAWHSLQTGPRITELVVRKVPDKVPYQRGYFFIRDGAALLPISAEPADRWVTTEIFGEPLDKQGGTPPTVVGGLYIDAGSTGVGLGMLLVGWLFGALRRRCLSRPGVASMIVFTYLAAYLCLSIYSYLSLKTTVLTVLALSAAVAVETTYGDRLPPLRRRSRTDRPVRELAARPG